MRPVDTDLAAFLDALDAQLGDLPPQRRVEILGETRQHLEAMIAARRADGLSESDAWHSAREAFGDAETIGRDLAREWKRAPRVETVGTPLSKREKLRKFAGPLLLSFVGCSLVLSLMSWLEPYHLQGLLLLALTLSGLWFQIWRHRKQQISLTTDAIFPFILLISVSVIMALEVPFAVTSNIWFGPIIVLIYFIGFICTRLAGKGMKRRIVTTVPWRYSPRYSSNPIAAEEEYRLAPKVASVTNTIMGCLLWIYLGWRFFGFGVAAGFCIGEIALAYLYARWLDSKTS